MFPYVTNGNIYAPVMMVAEKAADLILGNTPLPAEPVEFYRHGGSRSTVKRRPSSAWSASTSPGGLLNPLRRQLAAPAAAGGVREPLARVHQRAVEHVVEKVARRREPDRARRPSARRRARAASSSSSSIRPMRVRLLDLGVAARA